MRKLLLTNENLNLLSEEVKILEDTSRLFKKDFSMLCSLGGRNDNKINQDWLWYSEKKYFKGIDRTFILIKLTTFQKVYKKPRAILIILIELFFPRSYTFAQIKSHSE